MVRFVTLDAAPYLSTPDTNLMPDADAAQFQQGIGGWARASAIGSIQNPAVSSAVTPVIGDQVGQTEILDTSVEWIVRTPDVTVSASTQYTFIVSTQTDSTSSGEFSLRLREYAGAGYVTQESVACTPGATWGESAITITTSATTDTLKIWLQGTANSFTNGDNLYWDAACLRQDDVELFVPSLRISGASVDEIDMAPETWAPTNTRYIVASRTGGTSSWFLRWDQSLLKWYRNTGSLIGQSLGNPTAADGERATLKVTVDPSTGQHYAYLNGVEFGSVNVGAYVQQNADTPLVIGDVPGNSAPLTADVYSYVRRDGIDGPIVAKFTADDVHESLGYGVLTDGATFTDSETGRTWTVNGTGAALNVTPHKHGQPLKTWLQNDVDEDVRTMELVGALNYLNGTTGVEMRKARDTFFGP